jgi:hypothetical protein
MRREGFGPRSGEPFLFRASVFSVPSVVKNSPACSAGTRDD